MTDEQSALLEKSHRALEAARHNLDRGDPETAINRAYYAAFYVATAMLLKVGETPKTHSGTHVRFRRHFAGALPESTFGFLERAHNLRQRADYDALTLFDERAAADLLADAEYFVAAVEQLLQNQ